tara:strand:+ start:678 stop:1346 length:669 start_codon:yes stop_codon:yes gene_type:complete
MTLFPFQMGVVNAKNYITPGELKYKTINQYTYVDNMPVGCWAVRDLNLLDRLKNQDYNFDVIDDNHRTPIHYAMDYPDAFQFLLQTNVPLDRMDLEGNTPLHYAVMSSHEICIKPLMGSICVKNYAGYSPFHVAVKESKYEMVCCMLNHVKDSLFLKKTYLVNEFMDANQMSPVHHAICNRDFKMLGFLKDFIEMNKIQKCLTEYGKDNYTNAVEVIRFLSE